MELVCNKFVKTWLEGVRARALDSEMRALKLPEHIGI